MAQYLKKYSIIIDADADEVIKRAAEGVATLVEETWKISTDVRKDEDGDVSPYEIVVGNTDRVDT